jgi:ParB-like chromosome segregation protein Spo0J
MEQAHTVFTSKKEIHPVADIFPAMAEAEFNDLCESIRENGQREAIWLFDNKIIDGRHRYKACEKINIEPRFAEYKGDESSLLAFVMDINLHRRHLSASQRAMVASDIANMRRGEQEVNASIDAFISQPEAAKMLNVSRISVQRAKKVQEFGSTELIDAVNKGEIAVSSAVVLADLPKPEQTAIVEERRSDLREMVKELREEKLGGEVNESELQEVDDDADELSSSARELGKNESAKFESRRWRVWFNNLERMRRTLNSFHNGGLEVIDATWQLKKRKMMLRSIKKLEAQIIPIREALKKSVDK